MKLPKVAWFFILLLIAIQGISPTTAQETPIAKKDNLLSDSINFLTKYQKDFTPIDTQSIVGYAKAQNSHVFLAYDQAQVALNYLALAEEAQNSNLIPLRDSFIQDALAPLKFMTTYLVNPLTREKQGLIEFWDTYLQTAGLVRVSKLARDQALTLLTIDKILTFIDNGYGMDNTTELFYKEDLANLWQFLTALYDTVKGGWYTKSTAINQTASSVDTTKRTADNMIIISALADISHVNLLSSSLSKTGLLQILTKSINFFIDKFLVNGKGIVSYGSSDGSSIANDTFFAEDNALFGLTLLKMYSLTSNSSYLSYAEYIWSYLKQTFWDVGPGGLFIGVNAAGDTIIAGKSIEDQIFFSLLSLQLASLEPSNVTYLAYFLQSSTLIFYNFVKGTNIASSTDIRFNPSSEYFLRSATYYIDFLSQIPHISAIFYPSSIIIGSKLSLNIFINNYMSLPLNISITADNYLNPVNTLSSSNNIQKDIEFNRDIQSGTQNIYLKLYLSKTLTQTLTLNINFTPNVRIPNGLIYLAGAGILAVIIFIVRRPPEFLKKYIQDLKNIQTEIPNNETHEQE